jgi:hypothetical protein
MTITHRNRDLHLTAAISMAPIVAPPNETANSPVSDSDLLSLLDMLSLSTYAKTPRYTYRSTNIYRPCNPPTYTKAEQWHLDIIVEYDKMFNKARISELAEKLDSDWVEYAESLGVSENDEEHDTASTDDLDTYTASMSELYQQWPLRYTLRAARRVVWHCRYSGIALPNQTPIYPKLDAEEIAASANLMLTENGLVSEAMLEEMEWTRLASHYCWLAVRKHVTTSTGMLPTTHTVTPEQQLIAIESLKALRAIEVWGAFSRCKDANSRVPYGGDWLPISKAVDQVMLDRADLIAQ